MDVVGRSDLRGIWLLPALPAAGALVLFGVGSAFAHELPPAWLFWFGFLIAIGLGGLVPLVFLVWFYGRNAVLADDLGLAVVKRGRMRRSFAWTEIDQAYWYGGQFWSNTPGLAPGGAMVFKKPQTRWSAPVRVGSVIVVMPKRREALGEVATAYLRSRIARENGETSTTK